MKKPTRSRRLVQKKLAESSPNYEVVARYAHAWFKKNARNFHDSPFEIGFALYWSPNGNVVPGTLVQGEAAEVEWPEEPNLGIEVGSIHSHTGSSGELSPWDMEQGQAVANKTGTFYTMFVIGPDDEGEGITMVEEVFEPEPEPLAACRPIFQTGSCSASYHKPVRDRISGC